MIETCHPTLLLQPYQINLPNRTLIAAIAGTRLTVYLVLDSDDYQK